MARFRLTIPVLMNFFSRFAARRFGFAAVAWVCFALGMMLLFEVIRPFRDMNIDGPIALWLWGLGALVAIVALWRRQGAVVLQALALSCNLLALGAVLVFIYTWHPRMM